MSDTLPNSTAWLHQFCQESSGRLSPAAAPSSGFSDAATVNGGDLTPRGTIGKPTRRRSRASKKTPTTLLNASTTNFRALVQQYTGCSTTSSGTHRGPVNLNFALAKERADFTGSYKINGGHEAQLNQDEDQWFQQQQQQLYREQQYYNRTVSTSGNNNGVDSAFCNSNNNNNNNLRSNMLSLDYFCDGQYN